MKKYLLTLFFSILVACIPLSVDAQIKTLNCWELTGGGTRALDSYAVADLKAVVDGVRALVVISSDEWYYFEFQSAATDAENTSTHPYRVRPDDYSTSGVWYEQSLVGYFASNVTVDANVNLGTVGTDEFQIGGNRALAMPVDNTNLAVGYQAGNSLASGSQHNYLIGYQAGYS